MKWTDNIKQKSKTALVLTGVLGLLLLNNIAQSQQFERIVKSFSSLYEDRLIAESYIYEISELLQNKRFVLEYNSKSFDSMITFKQDILKYNKPISKLITQYGNTKFIQNEQVYFDSLLLGMENLIQFEEKYFVMDRYAANNLRLEDSIKSLIGVNLNYLSKLSDIQIYEGNQMNKESKETLMSNVSSSQLESSFLIIIAIIIQMLIFSSNTRRTFF